MPAGERRSSSGNAVTTALSANVNSSDTTLPILSSTGYPDGTNGPFFVKVDSETIKCVSRTGLNLNVQTVPVTGRGWENTSAASHTTSSPVNLVFTSTDADQANEHYSSTILDHHTQYLTTERHDVALRHPIAALPLGSPGNSAPGDTANAGVAASVARSDHRHGRETGGFSVVTAATRPASPVSGQTIVESDTGRYLVWDGSAWVVTTTYGGGRIDSVGTFAGALVAAPVTYTTITWNPVVNSGPTFISNGGNTFTVPAGYTGTYGITATLAWSIQIAEVNAIDVVISGVTFRGLGTGGEVATVSIVRRLNAGDTFFVRGIQNNVASRDITSAYCYLYRLMA